MNKTKNYLKIAGLSALMSLLPSKFTPAIAQNLQTSQEKKFDDVVKKYMTDYDSKTVEFLKDKTFNDLGHCIDGAGLVSEDQDAQIEQLIKDFYAKDGIEVVFITNNHIKNGFAEEFAVDYGNARGVGDNKYYSNGIVIMQNPKDLVLGIGVGTNVQFVMTTSEMKDKTLSAGKPYFRNGDEVGALRAMLEKIDELLTKNDKNEMSSDKQEGTRELTKEEKERRDELLLNILYAILGLGAAGASGIVVKNRKDKYDDNVRDYNNIISKISNNNSTLQDSIKTAKDVIEKLGSNIKYTNIHKEVSDMYNSVIPKIEKINISTDKYIGSFSDFAKNGSKIINEKINAIKFTMSNFSEISNSVLLELSKISNIYDKINKAESIRGEISSIKINDKQLVELADEYEKDGFIIGKVLDKSINDVSAQIDSIFEQLKNEEYYRSIKVLDESILAFENISKISKGQNDNHDQLILRMSYYTDKAKYISQNTVDDNSFANASDIYGDLMTICPKELISTKISLDDIKNNINLHPKLVERINNIYETKNLEKLANAMNMYIDNTKDTKEKITEAKSLLDKQSKAKSDCEAKMKKIKKIDDIYYYESDLEEKNKKYINLSNKVSAGKNDWSSLYTELVQFDNEYSSLKSKADKKEENDNKPVSTYKSDDNNTNNTRGSNNNDNRSDDNRGSGGGSMTIGGGGDTNY